jgi:hypothetical protein
MDFADGNYLNINLLDGDLSQKIKCFTDSFIPEEQILDWLT